MGDKYTCRHRRRKEDLKFDFLSPLWKRRDHGYPSRLSRAGHCPRLHDADLSRTGGSCRIVLPFPLCRKTFASPSLRCPNLFRPGWSKSISAPPTFRPRYYRDHTAAGPKICQEDCYPMTKLLQAISLDVSCPEVLYV